MSSGWQNDETRKVWEYISNNVNTWTEIINFIRGLHEAGKCDNAVAKETAQHLRKSYYDRVQQNSFSDEMARLALARVDWLGLAWMLTERRKEDDGA